MSTGWWTIRAVVAALVTALVLGGCGVRALVDITVRPDAQADVAVTVEFTGEIADVLRERPDILDEVTTTVADRTGTPATVRRTEDHVSVHAQVDPNDLPRAGAVTGVSRLVVTGDTDVTQVSVELRDVPDLLAAITSATADQPDAGAVAATMAGSTVLVVQVTFPGGITEAPATVGVTPDQLLVEDRSVTVTRTAADAGVGALLVAGGPVAPFNWVWVVLAVAVVGGAVAVVWAVRRDRDDPVGARRYP